MNRRHVLLAGLALGLGLAGCALPGRADAVRPGSGPTLPEPPTGLFGAFAGSVLRSSAQDVANLVVSPWSIATVLAMVRGGAAGQTAAELDAALGQDAARLPALVNTTWNAMVASEPLQLTGANQVWAQQGLPWEPPFLDHLGAFGAPLREEAISADPERVRTEVNRWVAEQTAGLIPELIKPGLVNPLTRLILVNALHAAGSWARPLSVGGEHPFTTSAGVRAPVPWLTGGGAWPWVETPSFAGTAIPVEGGETALVVLRPNDPRLLPLSTPRDSADLFDHVVTDASVAAVMDAPTRQVSLGMPVWKVASDLDLAPAMAQLGVRTAFDPGLADFSGMTKADRLHIGFLVHSAVMSVDENGFEAAAATAAGMEATSAQDMQQLVLDRPFGFSLVHVPTRTILFAGHVGDPTP